jgi:hypothetical protein
MNRNRNAKRLSLHREILLSLTKLQSVAGGVITKPPVSCAIPCPFTHACPITVGCPLQTARC